MADTPIFPKARWAAGTNQNSIPANDNSLRDQLMNGNIISQSVTAQPGSPTNGDAYILAATHTGSQWASFTQNSLVIYYDGTWYAYAPTLNVVVNVAGTLYYWSGSAWLLAAGRAPNIQTVTSSATVTPTFSDDMVKITAQAAGLTLANPTGTAIPGWGIVIRIKDNGTARSIAYGSQYRALGVTLPTSTVISKTLYLGMIYNSDDTKWDVTAVAQEA
jgi:hypothetical protein